VQNDRIITLQPIKIETIRLYGFLLGVEREYGFGKVKNAWVQVR